MAETLTAHPLFEQMQFDCEVAASAVDGVLRRMNGALAQAGKNKRQDVMLDQVGEMEEARDALPEAIEKVAVARGSARVAAYDAAAVKAHGKDIVTAIKQIAAWERQLLKLDDQVRKAVLNKEADIQAQHKVDQAYAQVVSKVVQLASDLSDDQTSIRAALDSFYDKAQQALLRRNETGLSLAQDDARGLALKKLETGVSQLIVLAEKAQALNGRASSVSRMPSMQDFGRARGRRDKLRDKDLPYLTQRLKDILALKLVPLDIAKALKTLGLPAAQKMVLARALAGDDAHCIKALGELAKLAQLGQSGKELLETLKKARVV